VRVLVFGGWGQLGSDLVAVAHGRHEVIRPRHDAVDVERMNDVTAILEEVRPAAVVNAAAFHKLELCESDPVRSYSTNERGAKNVARAAAALGARCVYISTDYVFDGEKGAPYTEDDPVSPVSVYGRSKAAGERAVLGSGPAAAVVRTSALFGHAGSSGKGGNFVETMLAKGIGAESISVVDDQISSPTATRDLAARLLLLLEEDVPGGVYHVTNAGYCSWYELAREALRLARIDADLTPVKTNPNAEVRRPPFSAMLDTRGTALGFAPLRDWQDALAWYVAERGPERRQASPSRPPAANASANRVEDQAIVAIEPEQRRGHHVRHTGRRPADDERRESASHQLADREGDAARDDARGQALHES
jgi:dTDP-4-dehydrorhamnose reductase